jgi:hypothetical protein
METSIVSHSLKIGNQNFQHIGDLDWYEGTLLALLQDTKTGNFSWLKWVDIDDNAHIWLFFPVTARSMRLYLEGKLSNSDMLYLNGVDEVNLIKMNGDWKLISNTQISKRDIPTDYSPSKEVFFEPIGCHDLEQIGELVSMIDF